MGIHRGRPTHRGRSAVRGILRSPLLTFASRDGLLRFTEGVRTSQLLHRLASKGAALASNRQVRIASQVLLLAGLVFLLVRLRSIWRDSHVELAHVGWGWFLAGLVVTTCGVFASGYIWLAILRQLGVRTRRRWAGIYFQAQLGKYIPGTVWQYAGRVALARTRGITLRAVAVSVPAELGACALAALLISLVLLGPVAAFGAALVLCLISLDLYRRDGILPRMLGDAGERDVPAGVRAALTVLPLYVGAWLAIGGGFWLTARALIDVPVSDIAMYIAAFCAAWLVGLVAVYAPGGIGVREALLVAILRGRIGSADAIVIAAASRAVLTLADLGVAGAGVLLLRRCSPSPAEESTGDEYRVESGAGTTN